MQSDYYGKTYQLDEIDDGSVGQSLNPSQPRVEHEMAPHLDRSTIPQTIELPMGDVDFRPATTRHHSNLTTASTLPTSAIGESRNGYNAHTLSTQTRLLAGPSSLGFYPQESMSPRTYTRPDLPAESTPLMQHSTTLLGREHAQHQRPFTDITSSNGYGLTTTDTAPALHHTRVTSTAPEQYLPPLPKSRYPSTHRHGTPRNGRKNKFPVKWMLLSPRITNDERFRSIIEKKSRKVNTPMTTTYHTSLSDHQRRASSVITSSSSTSGSFANPMNATFESNNLAQPTSMSNSTSVDVNMHGFQYLRPLFDDTFLFDDTGLVDTGTVTTYSGGLDSMTINNLNKTLKQEMESELFFAQEKQKKDPFNYPYTPNIDVISCLVQHQIPGKRSQGVDLMDHIKAYSSNNFFKQPDMANLNQGMGKCFESLKIIFSAKINNTVDPEFRQLLEKYQSNALEELKQRIERCKSVALLRYIAGRAAGEQQLMNKVKEKRQWRKSRKTRISKKTEIDLKSAAFADYDVFFANIHDALKR